MIFVDTNYFLRFLIDDGSKHHRMAVEFFEKESKRKKSLAASIVVFFEIFWMMRRFYKRIDLEAIEIMKRLLRMAFIEFEAKEILEKALDRAAGGIISLEDCFNLEWAKAKGIRDIATFDKKMIREWKKNYL